MQDIIDNKRARTKLLGTACDDSTLQEVLKRKCANGIEGCIYWFNHFAWLYEPRGHAKILPFVTYDFQDNFIGELITHINTGKDLFVDKSRDMGATWVVLGVFTWGFIFHDWSTLVGSRKEEEVDKLGDLDTLLPKVRFMLKRTPVWMRGDYTPGWKNIVGANNQSIVGESTNDNFGTGGRRKAVMLDEFSKWGGTASTAWTSVEQTTPCRIAIATPFGSATKQAQLRKTNIDQVHLHWTLHPKKSLGLYNITNEQKVERGLKGGLIRSPWYDFEAERMTEEEIAQELDINYERSAQGRVYGAEWDELVAKGRLIHLEYDPSLATFSFWDFGIGDLTAIGVAQVSPAGEVYITDYYENNNQPIQHYYDWLMSLKDREGNQYNFSGHYGDIAGNHRELATGRSIFEWLQDRDVFIEARRTNPIDEIHAVKMMLPRTWIDERLTKFAEHMNNFRYERDEKLDEYKQNPLHDIHSHCCKALSYFAINHFEPAEKKRDPRREKSVDEIIAELRARKEGSFYDAEIVNFRQ